MTLDSPTEADLNRIACQLGFDLSPEEVRTFRELVSATIQTHYGLIDSLPEELPAISTEDRSFRRPGPEENPLNAWYVRTAIGGGEAGLLAGKSVALKDSICLAGVPMMHGAAILEGYTPEVDATVARRVLDNGGVIAGKANCEYLSFSGGSHTCANGPVQNPHRPGYAAGGSSSGCAALVAAGEVDMAIGGDQAGSVRIPAALCGVYGMKPTFGLIPYTGVCGCEVTLDTLGPISATVADNALLLRAISGTDGIDPRQSSFQPKVAVGDGDLSVDGLRIGIVEEGFGHEHSEPDVDERVYAAARKFERLGAKVESVSIPEHRHTTALWAVIAIEGGLDLMIRGNGFGTNREDLYLRSLMVAQSRWRKAPASLPDGLKMAMLAGEYMSREGRGTYYAKAQNLRRRFRAVYESAFDSFDLLVMPTVPMKAFPLPRGAPSLLEGMAPGLNCLTNTAAFNLTGHPSLSTPCAMSDGLPIGMMISGRFFEEATLYRAAGAFAAEFDWKTL